MKSSHLNHALIPQQAPPSVGGKSGLPDWFSNAATVLHQSFHQATMALWLQLPAAWGGAKCTHTTLPLSEGKLVCPDCGEGFVGRWVRLRCHHCKRVMPSRYALGKAFQTVMPLNACCKHCGHRAAVPEYLDSPDVFQMQDALLVLEGLAEMEKPSC